MKRPIEGVTFERVALVRVIDGDTLVIRPRGVTSDVHVRLLGCWCPELHRGSPESRELARAARDFATSRCKVNEEHLTLHIPFPPEAEGIWDGLIKAMSFGRVHGHLWLDDEHTLEECLILHGLGFPEKPSNVPAKEFT